MKQTIKIIALLILFAGIWAPCSKGEIIGTNTGGVLRVTVEAMQSLVFKDPTGQWTGFEVDLLNAVAGKLGFTNVVYQEVENFGEIFDDVIRGDADLAGSGITITAGREEKVDFTTSYLSTGLGILVKKVDPSVSRPTGLSQNDTLLLLLSTLVTLSILSPRKKAHARSVLASLLIFALVGNAIVSIKSSNSRTDVEHFDLRGKLVATEAKSTSVGEIVLRGGRVTEVKKISEACELLKQGKVEAVVFDAPVLKNFVTYEGGNWAEVRRGLFAPQQYGFALQQGSPLRVALNIAILQWLESAAGAEAKVKYFGLED